MNQFESRLLAEGVRTLESDAPNQSTHANQSGQKNFETLVLDRAQQLAQKLQITPLFVHFHKLTTITFRLLAFLLFVLGALAVKNMLFTEQLSSVNFFWALTLFFIPNLLMLCVWLFLFLKPSLIESSNLMRFTLALMKLIDKHFNKQRVKQQHYWALFSCYFEIHFSQDLGRYLLSKLTHLLWLSYFSGALLMSIVMLATHQVDFIWQTSILSAEAFQTLTHLLAYVPHKLGFIVPSIEQIQQSHVSTENLLDAENRRLAWSSLLISSLLLYGLLPRLLLYMFVCYQFKASKLRYCLELSLPYYVQLRQLLKPNKTTLGITDADEEVLSNREAADTGYTTSAQTNLTDAVYPVAIELSAQQFELAKTHLRQMTPISGVNFINALDHSSQQSLLADIVENNAQAVVLYVALNRVPDRGLKRFVSKLVALSNKPFHLLLLIDKNRNTQRDNDWYRFAESVGIKLDNILHVEIKGDNNE